MSRSDMTMFKSGMFFENIHCRKMEDVVKYRVIVERCDYLHFSCGEMKSKFLFGGKINEEKFEKDIGGYIWSGIALGQRSCDGTCGCGRAM